jgi:glycolate oxidase iron-sulfur subunit
MLKDKELKKVNACISCGLCKSVCPTYRSEYDEAYSPRGRILLAKKVLEGQLPINDELIKVFDHCILCRNCENICPNEVQYKEIITHLRAYINENEKKDWIKYIALKFLTFQGNRVLKYLLKLGSLFSFFVRGKFNTIPVLLPYSSLKFFPKPRRNAQNLRGKVFSPKGKIKETIIFFPGCMYENFYTETARNIITILQILGYRVVIPKEITCCGGPHYYSGFFSMFKKLKEQNIKAFREAQKKYKVKKLLVTCPTGGGTFKEDYSLTDLEVVDFTEILLKEKEVLKEIFKERKERENFKGKYTVHYPCHFYTAMKLDIRIFDELIELIFGEGALIKGDLNKSCCGFGGLFSIKNPSLSEKILREKIKDFEKTKAQIIITTCPGCILQITDGIIKFSQAKKLEVKHLADIMVERLKGR